MQVYKCQHSLAAGYLAELCQLVSNINSHRLLWSADWGELDIQVRPSSLEGCACGHARPSVPKSSNHYKLINYASHGFACSLHVFCLFK